jgi:hypothetical protein
MKIVGQPESYSEILQRIFYSNFASGIICTIILAQASPAVKSFIDSISTKADLFSIKDLKALLVLIPFGIVLLSRIIRLHDKISDLLRIRFFFDTRYILYSLAHLTKVTLTKDLKKIIGRNRDNAMRVVFYKYASFIDPIIDTQLVRTAADNWGWFWSLLESLFLFGLTAFILWLLDNNTYVQVCLIILLIEFCLLLVQWFECRKSAERQVEAITSDNDRRTDISAYFSSL